ncbi:hypothetical protein EV643_103459 [Kribbella sp. VKM Ac-2527]|uniref:Uncharacterized protein n=1 Tax=Kribbella caucasensis TaxID=2512215 RepID=A0A4R6KNM9_9ACTN|nr:hypothetical protein EV643_103459 [Kribbella sp. VKM Ac-2527]
MTAERDDPLRTQLLGGKDAEQSYRPVTYDRNRLAGAGLGSHGGEPTGAEYVGSGHQGRDQLRVGHPRCGDQRAVGQRDAGPLGLGTDRSHQHAVYAVRLITRPADLAGVVGRPERADHEIAHLDVAHLVAPVLDDTDVLVTHHWWSTGSAPRYGHRSLPQMQVADSRMMASVGSRIFGSSRSSTRTFPRKVHHYLAHRELLLATPTSCGPRQQKTTSQSTG